MDFLYFHLPADNTDSFWVAMMKKVVFGKE